MSDTYSPLDDGWEICPSCEGEGVIDFGDDDVVTCTLCDGEGKVET